MQAQSSSKQTIVILDAASELGQAVVRQGIARGHSVWGIVPDKANMATVQAAGGTPITADLAQKASLTAALRAAPPDVVINLTPQRANSLLHDGHKWKGMEQQLATTTDALAQATTDLPVGRLIHASYAFLYGNAHDATESTGLQPPANDPIFQRAIQAEERLRQAPTSAVIARLGYLYGPQSRDLRAYVRAFRLGRLYFAGPAHNLANWLHTEDAANALIGLAELASPGEIYNVVDTVPGSFGEVMDHFSHLIGHKHPLHIPLVAAPLARVTITKRQMELLDLSTSVANGKLRAQLGWDPRYASARDGMAAIVQAWNQG